MKLEIAISHNCDCVPDSLECKILKSKYKLPSTLTGRNNSKIKLRTVGGKTINIVTEDDWFRKKDNVNGHYYGSIVNSYLIIWNVPLTLKVVLISAIWSDPIELGSIPNCNQDGVVVGVCFDPMTTPYPLPEEYSRPVYELVLKLLSISLQIPQDQTNDSNEFVKM